MYSDQYPSLYKAFPFDNFEVLIETLESYYGQLFNLPLLEQELSQKRKEGSYVQFFTKIFSQLADKPNDDLYTPEQISHRIDTLLHTDNTIRDCFLSKLIFLPELNGEVSPQIGFQEKLAMGRLKVPEPVTYLDMLRITYFLQTLHHGKGNKPVIAVVNLANLTREGAHELLQGKRAVMINLNLNPKDTPKWAVIDLAGEIPRIYCENPLLESERRELDKRLGIDYQEVSPGKADFLISTGYTAIAWLDQNITHGWNFDTSADFNVLFGDYALTIFRADAGGVHFGTVNNEYDRYVTEGLKAINNACYGGTGKDPFPGSNQWGSFSLYRMAGFATLGSIEGEDIPYNDLAKVIEVVGRHSLSTSQFEYYSGLGFRSKIPRFSQTLIDLKILEEEDKKVSLSVPEAISYRQIESAHQLSCQKTRTDNSLLRFVRRNPRQTSQPAQEDIATSMVLTVFRTRAKVPTLQIQLPERFQLNEEERKQIVRLMQDNAYVTELLVNEDNQSLRELKKELLPVFARNRWLAENNYLPPFYDNYWQRAAKYWLIHLSQHTDLLEEKYQHELFKRCVEEMGLRGLQAVLAYLSNPELGERLLGVYGAKRPAFYLACQTEDLSHCLNALIMHLQAGSSFPFAHLGVAYQPGHDASFVKLIKYVNQLDSFESLQLTQCLQYKDEFARLLQTLSETAKHEGWTGIIVIPELENKNSLCDEYRELHSLYRQLNNVILHNRHLKEGAALAARIKEVSAFEDLPQGEAPEKPKSEDKSELIVTPLFTDEEQGPWPLHRGGAVQLQIQQQQEIQQSRQVQQENQKMQMHVLDQVITSELVTYDSIDTLLGSYYQRFKAENTSDTRFAALWQPEHESELKGFFHTWINANPKVEASQIIQGMTQEAAKMLLRHQSRFSSGLSLDNLPRGFYVQRSKTGGLILCYDAEISLGFVSPLTLALNVTPPKAQIWEGDFRLFNLDYYLAEQRELITAEDFAGLVLFEMMQPQQNYDQEFQHFCQEYPEIGALVKGDEAKVRAHWLVFFQAWLYAGDVGVHAFLALEEEALTLSLEQIIDHLLANQAPELRDWVKNAGFDLASLKALGQAYYLNGDEPLALLLTKLQQLEAQVGQDFFQKFQEVVLIRSEDFNSYLTPAFFNAMDALMASLSSYRAEKNRAAFLRFCALHLDCVGWEQAETLWNAFDYFVKNLNDMGIELEGDEFDGLSPQNMLVACDRILLSLRNLPGQNMQSRFLKSLSGLDLTQGGVHYAIQHERFKFFDAELALQDFVSGTPTYAPNLAELYDWPESQARLNMKRILASRVQFSHEDYHYLSQELVEGDLKANKHALMWLLYTQFEAGQTQQALVAVRALPAQVESLIGEHLHEAVFTHGHVELNISLPALIALKDVLAQESVRMLLQRYPHGNMLEALSILHQSGQMNRLPGVLHLFAAARAKPKHCPDFLFLESYKLAALFGASPEMLDEFLQVASTLKVAVQHEAHGLIKHLLSVNYATSNKAALAHPDNWRNLIQCLENMNAKPAQRSVFRKELIHQLMDQGIQFKRSKSGEFRYLTPLEYPASLNVFVDHQDRMWAFLSKHIVVPAQGDAEEALKPLLAFFQRLQLNRTYLNEVEPLLAILEKTQPNVVWSVGYFVQMIDALKSDNDQVSFPLDMLQVMLHDELLGAKPLDSVEKDFPKELLVPLKSITANLSFNRSQQAKLCQLLLKEFTWTKTNPLTSETINLLSAEQHAASRDYALNNLLACTSINELSNRLEKFKKLLNHARGPGNVPETWEQTAALWIKAMTERPQVEVLFNSVMSSLLDEQADRRAQLLHIIGWSSVHQGLRSTDEYRHELTSKAPKLVGFLTQLSDDELSLLARCYPKQPAPGAADLLNLLKQHQRGQSLERVVNDLLCNPHPEDRADYQRVAKTREGDLQRMLTETKLIDGKHSLLLAPEHIGRISLMFSQLKQLESGKLCIEGTHQPVARLTQAQLAEAFHRLSQESQQRPQDDLLQAQIWALLFEALGRTTRKYPHMAQQFALIANDVVVTSPTRVLQLATGEGKSHFVALRAAYHAAQGKVVDVCTAKRSLAQRDLEDYQDLFKYLNLTATYIDPKSSREAYLDEDQAKGRIHYSTLGDLSLFLDEQSFQGRPITIDPKQRIGLGDELDFIYFDEGRKTEYNYARPTGRTPKQMIWFYQAVNAFYKKNEVSLKKDGISRLSVEELVKYLYEVANKDEDKQRFIDKLRRDGVQLVSWLQSAHEAHQLEKGVGFTVREENIQIGEAAYLMKEIIPLSTDNQKVVGSTFSSGVHQLLAVRLNTEAKERGESQNYHVHAESQIISSQVAAKHMSTLWGSWEGFTGTVSYTQAQSLNHTQNTQVLQVSTNQRDLRFWHQPTFHEQEEQRTRALVKQLRGCLQKKQSILFSCKNDQQVLWIKDELSKRLNAEELLSLIFYTNEDEESSSELLSRKQKQESWHGGKKQKGVGLVASGFGRGDNVGVEAVFLFDVNDINDLKQKGGRTARNGEEGEVFQFYLTPEMDEEYARLKRIVKQSPGVNYQELKQTLKAVEGANEQEQLFNQIMLLREYVFNLQNSANQGYRAGVAQFSGWGMSLVGTLMDPAQSADFVSSLTTMMRRIEKKWLLISSKHNLTPTEKVREIEAAIGEHHAELWEEYKRIMGGNLLNASPLVLKPYPEINLALTQQQVEDVGPVNKDLAFLGALLVSMPMTESEQKRVAEFPKQLQTLAQQEEALHEFAQDARQYRTVTDLLNQVAIRLKQLENPSPKHEELRKKALVTPSDETLFTHVDSTLKELFIDTMNKLIPSVQEEINTWLKKPGFATEQARVSKVWPLVRYLTCFSETEQKQWASEYLYQFNTLWLHTSAQSLAIRLSGNPMSYADNEVLWNLASSVAPGQEEVIFSSLQQSVATGSFAHRIRMLTRVEGWLSKLPPKEQPMFLNAFAQVMTQAKEGRDWDMFVKLVEKTARWWNKKNGAYRASLSMLWQDLAQHDLSTLDETLEHCLPQPKSDWIHQLTLTISLPTPVLTKLPTTYWQIVNELLSSNEEDRDVAMNWYLDSLRHKPKIQNTFNQWVANPERTLSLGRMLHKLSSYVLKTEQETALLRAADECLLNQQTFSLCCHTMANVNKMLDATLLSEEEKNKLHQEILSLPANKLVELLKGLHNFPEALNVMTQSNRDWDILVKLLTKTTDWYNKENGAYRSNLSSLWQKLAAKDFFALRLVLDEGLQKSDSTWIQMLEWTVSLSIDAAVSLPAFHWHILEQIAANNEEGVSTEIIARWYLDCVQQKANVLPILNQWLMNPKRKQSLPRALFELTHHQMTSEQEIALLHIADECLLDNQTFSLYCQIMANTSKILAETHLLSQEEKNYFNKAMLALPTDKLVPLLRGLKDYPEVLKANPQVFSALLNYARNDDLSAVRVEQLVTVLLQVAGKGTQTPNHINHLIKGVDRFQSPQFDEHNVERLLTLLRGEDALPAEQILFDNIAPYLEDKVSKGQQRAVKNTIDLFYRLAKAHRGDVERMFNLEGSDELKEMFDFKKQRKTMLSQRVIWMHLLNHEAFVTGVKADKELDSHFFQWSSIQNQEMLQRGLDLYLTETKNLLEQKPTARLGLERDLSINQQRGLLRLADEMAIIGKPTLTARGFADAQQLEGGLEHLAKNYQQGLFKSNSRATQLKNLQEAINVELHQVRSDSHISRYEALLVVFQKARLAAMQADLVDNKTRWFKLNRSGHSRYFSTLNQMEDLIVRHWVHDVRAVQSFQNYTSLCQNNLLQLTQELYEALGTHCDEVKEIRERPGVKGKFLRMFSNNDLLLLQDLKRELLTFNQENSAVALSAESLDKLTARLQKDFAKLPGHLQTLTKEVLMRSDALVNHLTERAAHPAKPILGSAPGEL